jgi:hypothetical protein
MLQNAPCRKSRGRIALVLPILLILFGGLALGVVFGLSAFAGRILE